MSTKSSQEEPCFVAAFTQGHCQWEGKQKLRRGKAGERQLSFMGGWGQELGDVAQGE